MQHGPDGVDALLELLAEDAVWVEPFTGAMHEGRETIRAFLKSPDGPQPNMRITIERIDVEVDAVTTAWAVESSRFARPLRGQDRFTIRKGKIARLETTLLEPPQLQ